MANFSYHKVKITFVSQCSNTLYISFAATAPQRGTEVRQLALPIQQTSNSSITKKDSATVTSPVEIKPIRIGDPKIRSKITFEVVTARVIESGGKKHVVRYLYRKFYFYICNQNKSPISSYTK